MVRSAWNLHHLKLAQVASQERQIERIAQSRLCGQSLENHENGLLGNRIAGAVL